MKRQNWLPGLIISLGIAIIAALPRMIRMEKIDLTLILSGIAYNFIFSFSCWLSHQFLMQQTKSYRANRITRAIVSIALVSTLSFFFDRVFIFLSNIPLLFPDVSSGKRSMILLLRGVVFSSLFYFIAYYMYMLAEKQKNILEIERLKQAQLAANLSSLKEQLSPHFLFNTLNTLSTLTQEKAVKDYVSELADVYRYVLQYSGHDTVTLEQELAFISSYLYIIKTRLEDAFDICIEVDDKNLSSKSLPPLTLQMLVENAIKHNIASSSKQLRIIIRSTAGVIEVSNNLQPKTSVQHSPGIGLHNVMQRYRLLFGREIMIEQTTDRFTVKLPLV
ncbi:MAG: hypothetical protein GXC78_04330 [Chitinophagaceae bacterium]|nr:hypothetical protein [Chitinophagaceae bacterium]